MSRQDEGTVRQGKHFTLGPDVELHRITIWRYSKQHTIRCLVSVVKEDLGNGTKPQVLLCRSY